MLAMALALATTAGGYLLVLAIILPVAGMLLSLVLGGRHAERIALVLLPAGLAVASRSPSRLASPASRSSISLGGWAPPLGIALRADGFSAVMLVTAALVIRRPAVSRARISHAAGRSRSARAAGVLDAAAGALGALNAVFLGGDLFNLYRRAGAADLRRGAAGLPRRPAGDAAAALRYLLFALFGSVLYLLGAALLYGAYGTLDIVLLAAGPRRARALCGRGGADDGGAAGQDRALPAASVAAAGPCRRAGGGQRRAVGAGGQGVVLPHRAALVRCACRRCRALAATQCSARSARRRSCSAACWRCASAAEAADRLFDGRADRLPVPDVPARSPARHPWSDAAWTGGMLQALSHAFAKAAMFMAAGLIAEALGHDRIAELARRRPGAADDRLRLRPRRAVADGPAAERRLRREVAAAAGRRSRAANGGGRW